MITMRTIVTRMMDKRMHPQEEISKMRLMFLIEAIVVEAY